MRQAKKKGLYTQVIKNAILQQNLLLMWHYENHPHLFEEAIEGEIINDKIS